jgi:ribose 5-phosphate isomerase A
VHTGVIADPVQLERELHAIPGVLETGLFIQRADIVLVASGQGVRVVRRAG